MRNLKIIIFIAVGSFSGIKTCFSQPYLDILNTQYVNSPDDGIINQNKNATKLKQFSVASTLPFQFRNKSDAIILSPAFEVWSSEIESANNEFEKQYGLALPVSFLKTLANPEWSIISTLIVRKNGYDLFSNDNWQIGGAMVVAFKANENLTYKLGVYANGEFFGLFIIPLVGIDWKINKRTNLFGVLPGGLTLEHKLHRNIYTGASFRAITSSYRMDDGYWRLDENRLGIYLDYYLSKHFVLNTEVGHSVLRKIRTGVKDKFVTDLNASDNAYIKFSLAYRIRFR